MAFPQVNNFPRTPINYSSEYLEYYRLILKESPLTDAGNLPFESTSSGITHNSTTGEVGLMAIFLNIEVLRRAILFAEDIESIQDAVEESITQRLIPQDLRISYIEAELSQEVQELQDFSKRTGFGGSENFGNTDIINVGETTAEIDTAEGTATFDETGLEKAVFEDFTRSDQFNTFTTRIKSTDFKTFTPDQAFTGQTVITGATNGYEFVTGDSIAVGGQELTPTGVTGSSQDLDFTTTPRTWDRTATTINVHKIGGLLYRVWFISGVSWGIDSFDGTTETQESLINSSTNVLTVNSTSVTSDGSHIVAPYASGTSVFLRIFNIQSNPIQSTLVSVDSGQTSISAVKSSINSSGKIAVVIHSTNSEDTFNLPRVRIGNISNGVITWEGAVVRLIVSQFNTFSVDVDILVLESGSVVVLAGDGNNQALRFIINNTSLSSATWLNVNWSNAVITTTGGAKDNYRLIEKVNGLNPNRVSIVSDYGSDLHAPYTDNEGVSFTDLTIATGASNGGIKVKSNGETDVVYQNADDSIGQKTIPNGSTIPSNSEVQIYSVTSGNSSVSGGVLTSIGQSFTATSNAGFISSDFLITPLSFGITFNADVVLRQASSVSDFAGTVLDSQPWSVQLSQANQVVRPPRLKGNIQTGNIYTITFENPTTSASNAFFIYSPTSVYADGQCSAGANIDLNGHISSDSDTLIQSGTSPLFLTGLEDDESGVDFVDGSDQKLYGLITLGAGFELTFASPVTVSPIAYKIPTQFSPIINTVACEYSGESDFYLEYTANNLAATEESFEVTGKSTVADIITWSEG